MYKELTLLLPGSLLKKLELQAEEQGISLDLLCLRLLSEQNQEETLTDPYFYGSLSYHQVKEEIRNVMESDLPREEAKRRVKNLEFQINKRYIR
jgi:hypothetical protein